MVSRSLLLLLLAAAAPAQWLNHPTPGMPRTKDGNVNLAAPAPRLNGKPDLSGIWLTDLGDPKEIEKMLPGIGILAVPGDDPSVFQKYFFDILADYKPGEVTLSAEAQRIMQEKRAAGENYDEGVECLPTGIPEADLIPLPHRIVHTANLMVILYEDQLPREIYLDGRKLPEDPWPLWRGYSVGRWDGETMVIETSGVNPRAPLDGFGHPRTEKGRIIERLRRRDFGHMDVQVTIEDPAYYSKPISFKYGRTLQPDTSLLEYVCNENEKDAEHMKRASPK